MNPGDSRFRIGEVVPLSRKELLELRKELETSVRNFWNERNKTRPSLAEVLEIFRRKGINSRSKYERQREVDPELQNTPVNMKVYNKEGWKGWPHFRGEEEKLPLKGVLEMFREKGIDSQPEYERQREADPELQNIPKQLDYTYQREGWKGWRHFRGEQEKPSLEEVLEMLQRKGINSKLEYERQREKDPELQNIPVNLIDAYKKEGWKAGVIFGENRRSHLWRKY